MIIIVPVILIIIVAGHAVPGITDRITHPVKKSLIPVLVAIAAPVTVWVIFVAIMAAGTWCFPVTAVTTGVAVVIFFKSFAFAPKTGAGMFALRWVVVIIMALVAVARLLAAVILILTGRAVLILIAILVLPVALVLPILVLIIPLLVFRMLAVITVVYAALVAVSAVGAGAVMRLFPAITFVLVMKALATLVSLVRIAVAPIPVNLFSNAVVIL